LNQANQKISEYQAELTKQEQKIVQQLNNSLKLGLDNPSLEKVIERIQELINKPPQTIYEEFSNDELEGKLNQTYQTIARLEKELSEKDAPFGENLENIKELELRSLEEIFGKGNNL
jgi:predicted RNase H-like nuclease (RuvC/YqgF family)